MRKLTQKKKKAIDFNFPPLAITSGPEPNQGAYKKMRRYKDLYTMLNKRCIEFYAYQTHKPEDGEITTDVYLAPHQTNHYALTHVDAEGVGKAARAIEAKGHRLRGWTHLHPMNLFGSSGTDKENNFAIITSMAHSSKTVPIIKEHKLEAALEGNEIVIKDTILGTTTKLNLKDAATPKVMEKLKSLDLSQMLKGNRETYRTALYGYSLILMNDERHYAELITFDTRTRQKKEEPISETVQLVPDPNAAPFHDRELMMDLLTRVYFNGYLLRVTKRIEDTNLRSSIAEELRQISKDEKLPTPFERPLLKKMFDIRPVSWEEKKHKEEKQEYDGSLLSDCFKGLKRIFGGGEEREEPKGISGGIIRITPLEKDPIPGYKGYQGISSDAIKMPSYQKKPKESFVEKKPEQTSVLFLPSWMRKGWDGEEEDDKD
ncbi:MAG: hypothetical protein ABIB71_07260 [Candidatus Woesearchaeota archaeon]